MSEPKKRGGYRLRAGRPTHADSAMMRVYKLFPRDSSRIRAKELEKEAAASGMGYLTLREGRRKLMEAKIAIREADSPRSVYYRLIGTPPWDEKIDHRVTKFQKIPGRAWLIFEEDIKMAEAQRRRLEQLLKTKPSKRRDNKIAAEITNDLSAMVALIGRALAKIDEGKGISITPDEYVSRVLEVRLHPLVAQLARLVKEGKVRGSHLHDALMILASRQV